MTTLNAIGIVVAIMIGYIAFVAFMAQSGVHEDCGRLYLPFLSKIISWANSALRWLAERLQRPSEKG